MTTLSTPPTGRARATMRDVAALAQVSIKTVSRVINTEGGVSKELAERVRVAAAQLEFRPHLGARGLRRADGRTATIGLVLDDITNPFSAAVHRAVDDAARERGLAVLTGSIVDRSAAHERELVAAFSARSVDGLIVMPYAGDQTHLDRERRSGLKLVFVDRAPSDVEADAVVCDNRRGAANGVRHLLAHGHRRVAFLGDRAHLATGRERHAGYVQALTEAGEPVRPEYCVFDLRTIDAADAAATALLALPEPPTALFSGQNVVSIGALRALRRAGAHRRVALVGFDDFALADLIEPAVTVVAQDTYEIGNRAAALLFARIDGHDGPFAYEVVPTRLIVRGSGELAPGPDA